MSRLPILSFRAAAVLALAVAATSGALVGCVQMPTEQQHVVDQRPSLSFRATSADPGRLEARVVVDGLDAGRVGDYLEGRSALRVLPGSHVVRVTLGGATLLEERVYLGDGVNRTMVLQ